MECFLFGMTSTNTRKANLEKTVSAVSGVVCEITVRDLRKFTISFDGKNDAAVLKLREFFAAQIKSFEAMVDFDCGQTYVYLSV